jgi:soluble lytic murein transglycosylase
MMQLIPETAREMKVVDPFDPEDNIRGGTRYLRKMLDLFNDNTDLALAAYNAGPGAVRQHGGIPPYTETRNYIQRVKRFLHDYR